MLFSAFIYRQWNSIISRYYTGRLDFGYLSPISEGLTIIIFISIFKGVVGKEFFETKLPFIGVSYSIIFERMSVIVLSLTTIWRLVQKCLENWVYKIIETELDLDFESHSFHTDHFRH